MSLNSQPQTPWHYEAEPRGKQTRHYRLFYDGRVISYRGVIELWQSSWEFREFYRGLLAGSSFEAFFWELPPVTQASLNRAFEFVLVESTVLAKGVADSRDFAEHFLNAEQAVVTFQNLGRDAWLIVPTPAAGPDSDSNACVHLAAFCRCASAEQQHALWQQLGDMLAREISERPLWVSSCGLGVYWLHLRLDQRPKYYNYLPYT